MDSRTVLQMALENAGRRPPHKKVADMSWDELREALLTCCLTDIPNQRAFEHCIKSPTQIHANMPTLEDSLDVLRHATRDELTAAIAQAFHSESPGNVFYLRYALFKAQADDALEAHRLMARINARLARSSITLLDVRGHRVVCRGMGFSYGIGINEQDAVEAYARQSRDGPPHRYRHRSPDCLGQVQAVLLAGGKVLSFRIQ